MEEVVNIQDQIGVVESNRTAYQVVMHDEGISPLYVIQCFQDWYSSAIRLFYNVLGDSDPTFLHFKSADVAGNRYVLAGVYQSLQADYTILLEKVKKSMDCAGKESENNDKNNKHMDKLKLLQNLSGEVESLAFSDDFDEDYITKKTRLYIKKCFGGASDYLQDLERISFTPSVYYSGMSRSEYYESFMNGKQCLSNLVSTMIEDIELSQEENVHEDSNNQIVKKKTSMSRNVFVVHGHDEYIRVEVEAFLRCIGYEPIVLFKEPNKGQTIIEKIEANANNVCYSIVLYTPCDFGRDKNTVEEKPRARQNVVFEHGYMCALLGRQHVSALCSEGVEVPGDLSGVVYTKYDSSGAWKYAIARDMKAIGLLVDMNVIK